MLAENETLKIKSVRGSTEFELRRANDSTIVSLIPSDHQILRLRIGEPKEKALIIADLISTLRKTFDFPHVSIPDILDAEFIG